MRLMEHGWFHAPGMGEGKSEAEMGRSGGLNKSADARIQPPVSN